MCSTKSIYHLWLVLGDSCTLGHEVDFFYIRNYIVFKSNLALQWATWHFHHNDNQDDIVVSIFVCKPLRRCKLN